jgi:hypothetical protein
MFDINNIYQITFYTSGFLFFIFGYINDFKYVNFLYLLKLFTPNVNNNINININNLDEYDCENQKKQVLIKKVTYSADTNFNPKQQPIKKIKSQSNMLTFSSARHERMLSYSHTYGNLLKIVPPNSQAKSILNELIKNKSNNIIACCNPNCRKKIDEPLHFAFDGYYCDESCRHFVFQNMHIYWNQLY